MDEAAVVALQLGREPQGQWRVAERCSFGQPLVIATAPMVAGQPFPTLYYLSCPHLREEISMLESAGEIERWRMRLSRDQVLRYRLEDADSEYRARRLAEGGGVDPSADVGIAGQRDVLGVKCLHAHVAAFLAGIDDPVGEGTWSMIEPECTAMRCGEAL